MDSSLNQTEVTKYNELNSYLHLSGILNILIPAGGLISALFFYFQYGEKWAQIRGEAFKVANFSLLEFLIAVIFGSLLPGILSSLESGLFSLFFSISIFAMLTFLVHFIFGFLFLRQFQRAKSGKKTHYPMSNIRIGEKVILFLEKLSSSDEDSNT